jgi:hypothetical protein
VAAADRIRRHERTIAKAVLAISILVLVVLGSTILAVRLLTTPTTSPPSQGWQRTPEVRVIMDSTADWARIMFNDLSGTSLNGVRVVQFGSHGWLVGNDTHYRIDAGFGLTFVDIIYNTTVVKTGDIVGFFKGNNVFAHTRMYSDVVLEINTNMRQVSIFLMLAGAGTTTFQFINKQTGQVIWQDTDTGNSFTQYTRRYMSPDVFFAKQQIQNFYIALLVTGAVVTIVALNAVPINRRNRHPFEDTGEGL